MKVSKVEKKEYEMVQVDSFVYCRHPNGLWYNSFTGTPCENSKYLEAAYQRFKNPPFKIEIKDTSSNLSYLEIQIKDMTLYSCNFSDLDILDKKMELEQALNSLLEDK